MDPVSIANLALGLVNVRTTISSFTEPSAAAEQINLQYLPSLEACLNAAHWNFARAQVSLAVLKAMVGTPENPTNAAASAQPPQPWLYSYAYPADCVQARFIMPTFNSVPSNVPGTAPTPTYSLDPVRFLVSTDLDAQGNRVKVILTNQPGAILVYTTRITDANLFDGQFVIAFSNYLAARISIPLSGDKAMMKAAWDLADVTTRQAQASNGNEGITVNDHIPDWIRVRGYASDWAYPAGSIFFTGPQNLTLIA